MRLATFPRGIYPPELKESTENKPLEKMPPPERVMIPLLQHFGNPAQPLVKKGDEVYLGQKIGEGKSLFSSSVHASVSGKVLAVEDFPHPLGSPVLSVSIANDGKDRTEEGPKDSKDPFTLTPDEIRNRVREAGIVGLGGAAFPTSVKLTPPKDKPIDTVIINGCECEPFLTSDYRLMIEYPDDILNGAELIRIACGAQKIIIGIEDNKKKAFEILSPKSKRPEVKVVLLKTKYPQGAEKNLIFALLRREVPRGGLPFDVGVVVQNVGTSKAIWEAVSKAKPLYERALTVSGDAVREPKNLLVRIGTPFKNVLDFCGGLNDNASLVVMGGPMMGVSQGLLEVPVVKGTSGILAWEKAPSFIEFPCIRCSRCISHCPMGLVPTQIIKYVKYDDLENAEAWGVLDCIECGCCQYVCPAKIPLVHWLRIGKSRIFSIRKKKKE